LMLASVSAEVVRRRDLGAPCRPAHGAVFVSAMDVSAGPAHDEDPVEKGLVQEDGMHLNETGSSRLVDALADAGFEPSGQPG